VALRSTSGAYVIHDEDIRRGRTIALTRNEDWWARDLPFWRNRFNYDRIHFSVIRDTAKRSSLSGPANWMPSASICRTTTTTGCRTATLW
jgi:hypothetical protein